MGGGVESTGRGKKEKGKIFQKWKEREKELKKKKLRIKNHKINEWRDGGKKGRQKLKNEEEKKAELKEGKKNKEGRKDKKNNRRNKSFSVYTVN